MTTPSVGVGELLGLDVDVFVVFVVGVFVAEGEEVGVGAVAVP